MRNLVLESRRAWSSKGKVYYGISKSENSSKIFKRSIYVSQDIKKGERFTSHNIKIVRPSFGLDPKYYKKIIGKRSNKNLGKAERMKLSYVK